MFLNLYNDILFIFVYTVYKCVVMYRQQLCNQRKIVSHNVEMINKGILLFFFYYILLILTPD